MIRPHELLLICGEPNLRRSFALVLENAGYMISSVASLSEGSELLGKDRFDLIILGGPEPEITADEILSKIPPTHPGTPILLLTRSTPAPSTARKILGAGQNYLIQPVAPENFLKRVSQILNLKAGKTRDFNRQRV